MEYLARLEQANPLLLVAQVPLQRNQQARQQRGAHDVHVRGDRVGQFQHVPVHVQCLQQAAVHEAVVDGFLVPRRAQDLARRGQGDPPFADGAQAEFAGGHGGRQPVVSVDARHLLDQVLLDVDVETAGRGQRLEHAILLPDAHAQAQQDAFDLVRIQAAAQHAVQAGEPQPHRLAPRQVSGRLGQHQGPGLAAADFQQQRGDALDGLLLAGGVHAALEAVRGIRVQPQRAGPAGNHGRREPGALQQDVAGRVRDARIQPAHDAGQRDRAGIVADGQDFRVQLDLFLVQQHEPLAGPAEAHGDAALQPVQVEGVHGLAQFHEHVVGAVHHRADAADAAATQGLLHPQGRGGGRVDAADDAPGVTGAALRVGQLDVQHVVDRGLHRPDLRRRVGHAQDGAHVAGQALDAQAVRPVGRQVQVDRVVVEPKDIPEIGPGLRFGRAVPAGRCGRRTGPVRAPSRPCRGSPRRAGWLA